MIAGGSGKPIPMLTFTSALAVNGKKISNPSRNVPNTDLLSFCILLHPFENLLQFG